MDKNIPTMAFKKCPIGYRRHGCCTCVIKCPGQFKDIGFHCQKPLFKIIKPYKSIDDCEKNNEIGCV